MCNSEIPFPIDLIVIVRELDLLSDWKSWLFYRYFFNLFAWLELMQADYDYGESCYLKKIE